MNDDKISISIHYIGKSLLSSMTILIFAVLFWAFSCRFANIQPAEANSTSYLFSNTTFLLSIFSSCGITVISGIPLLFACGIAVSMPKSLSPLSAVIVFFIMSFAASALLALAYVLEIAGDIQTGVFGGLIDLFLLILTQPIPSVGRLLVTILVYFLLYYALFAFLKNFFTASEDADIQADDTTLDSEPEQAQDSEMSDNTALILACPVSGRAETLDKTPDETFSSGKIGPGVVIFPKNNIVYAPDNATIIHIFPQKNAIGLMTDSGIEILIHVGIGTDCLNGEGFITFVQEGDHIKRGAKLLAFDMRVVRAKADSDAIPVVLTGYEGSVTLINGEKNYNAKDDMLCIK